MKRIAAFLTVLTLPVMAWAGFEAYNGTTSLNIFDKIQCSTGLTCSRVNGKLVMVSSPTVSTGALSLVGAEAGNATLTLSADESDDSGDDWKIISNASGNALTFTNDTSGSDVVKMTLSTAGALSGYLQSQITSTTTTLTAAQCGSTVVSDSADVLTLPEASTVLGCRYTFVCGFAGNLDVNPNDGTDVIGAVMSITGANTTTVLAPAAGDAIRCAAIGASITLEAVGANLWASIGASNGTWTDVN